MDKRAYFFRYIKIKNGWGFIALNNTEMTKDIEFLPLETWISIDNHKYIIANVCYSQNKVKEMMEKSSELDMIEKAIQMYGPDIYIVLKDKETVITVWKPDLLPTEMEIQYLDKKCININQNIDFEELRVIIANTMDIKIKETIKHDNYIYHNI